MPAGEPGRWSKNNTEKSVEFGVLKFTVRPLRTGAPPTERTVVPEPVSEPTMFRVY